MSRDGMLKRCKVCRLPATHSICCIVSTVRFSPRFQAYSKVLHFCCECLEASCAANGGKGLMALQEELNDAHFRVDTDVDINRDSSGKEPWQ